VPIVAVPVDVSCHGDQVRPQSFLFALAGGAARVDRICIGRRVIVC